MNDEFALLLVALGATFILTHGYVFLWLREALRDYDILYKFIKCPQCTGFWVGLVLAFLHPYNLLGMIGFGLIVSFYAYIINVILNAIKNIGDM